MVKLQRAFCGCSLKCGGYIIASFGIFFGALGVLQAFSKLFLIKIFCGDQNDCWFEEASGLHKRFFIMEAIVCFVVLAVNSGLYHSIRKNKPSCIKAVLIFYIFFSIILSISTFLIIFEDIHIPLVLFLIPAFTILLFIYISIILHSLIYEIKYRIERIETFDESSQSVKRSGDNTWATDESWLTDATSASEIISEETCDERL